MIPSRKTKATIVPAFAGENFLIVLGKANATIPQSNPHARVAKHQSFRDRRGRFIVAFAGNQRAFWKGPDACSGWSFRLRQEHAGQSHRRHSPTERGNGPLGGEKSR